MSVNNFKRVYTMAFFGKMKHYSVESMDELLASVGHLRPYLRVYDEKESILFNSRSRGESKTLSNFHASSVPLPWRGKLFTSVEAIIFYTYIAVLAFFDKNRYICQKCSTNNE